MTERYIENYFLIRKNIVMNLYGFFHFVYINFIRTHRYIPGGDEVAILLQELLLGVCQEAAVFLQRKLEDLQCEEQISVRS